VLGIEFRDLTTTDDFARVVEFEKHIWGYAVGDDVVPLPILAATVRRGAVLVGAFDGPAMVGFVFSIPAIYQGRLSHWSHMLGVAPPYRGSGLGRRLKLVQRERALALGIDLVEWTFDPLLAPNAHPWEIQYCAALAATLKGEDTRVIVRSAPPSSSIPVSENPGTGIDWSLEPSFGSIQWQS